MFSHLCNTVLLCLCLCAGFVALQQRVMSGEAVHVTDVPGGTVVWSLQVSTGVDTKKQTL
jgi:hypothetical protein